MTRLSDTLTAGLYRRSGAERWGVDEADFSAAVDGSVAHAFGGEKPSDQDLRQYVSRLHLEDLALARACALGREAAWEHFILEYRPVLYRSADALDATGGAREVADALYAELYGLRTSGEGTSLFSYFHGRSSLATWLRAVLSQRLVDRFRRTKREDPLPEGDGPHPSSPAEAPDPDRAALVPLVYRALRATIDQLAPRDRLRLRSYHGAGMTLAQIGRITSEHEATVSRQLARTRRDLRQGTERRLREYGLSDAQVARALELAIADPGELNLDRIFNGDTSKETS